MFNNNERRLRQAFNAVHREFEEHLESINANTEEILENRYMLKELNDRIAKVADDIGEIKSALNQPVEQKIESIELTLREQEVFLMLYMNEQGVNYSQVVKHTSLPMSIVQELVFEMITKGVPIVKQRRDLDVVLSLDIEFRELQSKHNIVGIQEQVGKMLTKDLQLTLVE